MVTELAICGASLGDGICQGAEPPEEWRETVNDVFVGELHGYRLLPTIEHEGEDEEVDHREDGTYRELPLAMPLGQYVLRGAYLRRVLRDVVPAESEWPGIDA